MQDVNGQASEHARQKAAYDFHHKAAETHELAAHAHRTAAEHNEKGDGDGGLWHAERALEFSDRAYKLAKEAHNKSGRLETSPETLQQATAQMETPLLETT